VSSGLFLSAFLLLSIFYFLNSRSTSAFTGPSTSAGVGSGIISSDSSNNLAIGTSTPSSTTKWLIVTPNSASTSYAFQVQQTGTNSRLFWVANDGSFSGNSWSGTINASQITPGTFGGASNYTFPSGVLVKGGMSIGTTTASALLHVQGQGRFYDDAGALNGRYLKLEYDGTTDIAYVQTNLGSDVVLGASSTTQLVLDQSGLRVGISDITPDAALEVALSGSDDALMVSSAAANNGNLLIVKNSGNVGIGTTTPGYRLDVQGGQINTSGGLCIAGDCKTAWSQVSGGTQAWIASGTNVYLTTSTNYVGIGTSSPTVALDVRGTGGVNSSNGFTGSISSGYVSAGTFGSLATQGNYSFMNGNLGIGTTTPATLLSVGNSTSALVATFGNGSGKIDVGTVDPLYTINGRTYATYLPGMTGQKEETTGEVVLNCEKNQCNKVIDFAKLEEGSDLWLFAKTIDVKKHFGKMTVLITPAFDGRVWYEKDTSNLKLTLYGKPDSAATPNSVMASYRLTAPRFDADKWQNFVKNSPNTGFIIND